MLAALDKFTASLCAFIRESSGNQKTLMQIKSFCPSAAQVSKHWNMAASGSFA
jgi:hypothetical protein